MSSDPVEGIRIIHTDDLSNIQADLYGAGKLSFSSTFIFFHLFNLTVIDENENIFIRSDLINNMITYQAQQMIIVGTPYEGGVFRCKLVLDADFPASPPKAYFLTKIFHPNIATNGSVCVNTLKKDWKPTYGISHIFQVIRCLLIVPFPESALNEEASKLFLDSYDEYFKRAKLMTQVHAKGKVLAHTSSSDVQASVENEEANDQSTSKNQALAADSCSTSAASLASSTATVTAATADAQAAKKVDIKKRALKRL